MGMLGFLRRRKGRDLVETTQPDDVDLGPIQISLSDAQMVAERVAAIAKTGEKHRFAEHLVLKGIVKTEAVKSALWEQKITKERLGAILVRNGFILQSQLTTLLLEFSAERIATEKVSSTRVPVEILEKHNIILAAETEEKIYVSTAGNEDQVRIVIEGYYPEKEIVFVAFMPDIFPEFIERIRRASVEMDEEDVPKEEMLERIIRQAMQQLASDIHVEPHGASYSVFYRKLGVRDHVYEGSIDEYHTVITQLKDRARLDIAERRIGQDGGFQIEHGNKYVDLRIATVATVEGEQAIIRILDPDRVKPKLDELGITGVRHWQKGISRQNGLCLICGATGSGKTTTLNSSIKEIDRFGKKIYTAEDPVEYRIPNVGQVSMNPQVDLTFARSIKNFMRADPDVIVIGEVRDVDTARNAVKGADTGHLMLATLHTSSIISSITRLRDLEIPSYELRYILRAVLVQTLVRTICKTCNGEAVYNGEKCQTCNGYGYAGRTIVSECMSFTDTNEVDQVLAFTDVNAKDRDKMRVPWPEIVDDAILKMLEGQTTSDELVRVFGSLAENRFEREGIDPEKYVLRKQLRLARL